MMNRRLFWFGCAALAVSCGSPTGGKSNNEVIVVNAGTGDCAVVSGTYEGTTTTDGSGCGWETDSGSDAFTVEQSGCDVSFRTDQGDFEGTVSGTQVTLSGAFDEDGGTFAISDSSVVADGETISGRVTYDFVEEGSEPCAFVVTFDHSRTGGPPVVGEGNLMDLCFGDSDCTGGLRCIKPETGGPKGNCSQPCQSDDDCPGPPGHEQNPGLNIGAENVATSQWGLETIHRAWGCYDTRTESGHPSDTIGDKYCYFVCGEFSSIVVADDGSVSSCGCFPNFTWEDPNDKSHCVWDVDQECSFLKPCVPADTTDDRCSGELSCLVNESLEGSCYEFRTGDQIEACVAQCTADSCDSACLSSCTGTECVDVCCDFTCE